MKNWKMKFPIDDDHPYLSAYLFGLFCGVSGIAVKELLRFIIGG